MYLPRFRHEDAPLLRKQLKRSAAVALYSWQPRTVAQHSPRRAHHASSNLRDIGASLRLGQGGKP